MKNTTYLCLLLLSCGLFACSKWEIPELKTSKKCQFPSQITAKQDPTNPKKYTFSVYANTTDTKSVTWKINTSTNTTAFSTVTQENAQDFAYTFTNTGTYTITAEITVVCGEKSSISTQTIVAIPTLVAARNFDLTDALVHTYLRSVAVANDGTVIANEGSTIKIWSYTSKTLLRTLKGHTNANGISDLELSADEKYLYSSDFDKDIIVWDWRTGAELRRLTGHTSSVFSLAISADNKFLVSASGDKTIRIWNIADGTLVRTITTTDVFSDISVSNDAKYIIGRSNNSIKVWNGQTGAEYWSFENGNVYSVAINPAGTQVWVQGNKPGINYLESFDIASKRLIKSYTGFSFGYDLKISNDGRYLTSGSTLIDTQTQSILFNFNNHFNYSSQYCNISANSSYIISGADNGSLALVTLPTGIKINNNPTKHFSIISNSFISKDLKSMIITDRAGLAKEWDIASGSEKRTLGLSSKNYIDQAAYASNSYWLRDCQTIEKFDLNGNSSLKIPISTTGYCILSMAASNDDQQVTVATYNGSTSNVAILNSTNGGIIKTIMGLSGSIYPLTYTKDSKFIIAPSSDKTVRVLDAVTGTILRTIIPAIANNANYFTSVIAVSNDSQFLVIVSSQQHIIYSIQTGAVVNTINLNTNNTATSLIYSPDGKYIASANYNKKINIIDVASGVIVKEITLENVPINLYYNATGTQLFVVTEKDFQVLNL